MKRIKTALTAAALAAALLLSPFRSRDAAKLIPVQTLCICADGGDYLVQTDAALCGRGADPARAFADLERTAPGRPTFSTAPIIRSRVTTRRLQRHTPSKGRRNVVGHETFATPHSVPFRSEKCRGRRAVMSSRQSRKPVLFPAWECFVPSVGILCSQHGNKNAQGGCPRVRRGSSENSARIPFEFSANSP